MGIFMMVWMNGWDWSGGYSYWVDEKRSFMFWGGRWRSCIVGHSMGVDVRTAATMVLS